MNFNLSKVSTFGHNKPQRSVLMDVCMRYVSVVRYRHNVQVKRWLEEDGMNFRDFLLHSVTLEL